MNRFGAIAVAAFIATGGLLYSFQNSNNSLPAEDLSANVSLGKRAITAPYVPGEAIVVVKDPSRMNPQSIGSMNINSTEYKTQEQDLKNSVKNLLVSKFGSDIEIDTKVLFDKRGAQFSEDRLDRMRKIYTKEGNIANSQGFSTGRLIYAKIKSEGKTTQDLLEIIEEDSDIVSSQPNYIYSVPRPNSEAEIETLAAENSETPEILWNIFNNENNAGVGADVAWDAGLTGKDVLVAVIDTGVDIDHPDLAANIWKNPRETNCEDGIDNDVNGFADDCYGWDFGDSDNNPVGLNFHGTHVAGIIAAVKDNSGVVGVAPDAKIMPLKVFPDEGFAQTIDVVNAIEYAWRNNVDVISTSLGREDSCSTIESQAIRQAMEAGVVVFTSSGNGDPAYDLYVPFSNAPAICDESFATGATDRNKNIPDYSNYFNEMVTAVGPGGTEDDPLLSTSVEGGYVGSSGTSMATPHASAIAALLFQKNPFYTPREIIDLLCRGSDDIDEPGKDMKSGCGFLNIQKILEASESNAPIISDVTWSPNPINAPPWKSTYSFFVCDPDNDLEGGDIRIRTAGTDESFVGGPLDWSSPPDVLDCLNPQEYSITINFENIPENSYCTDLQVSDAKGNLSNTLTDICITKEAEEPEDEFSIIPGKQTISIGQDPELIVVSGAENVVYSLNAGETGIAKKNCENNTLVCELTAPIAAGDAIMTISGMNGQYVDWANITVEPEEEPPPEEEKEFRISVSADKETARPGEVILYTITFKNVGTLKSAVKIVNSFDSSQLEILEVPDRCTKDESELVCEIGIMGTNNSGTIEYSAKVKGE